MQAQHTVNIKTRGQGFYEITSEIATWLGETGIENGLLTIFCRHTSASLTIQENADRDVQYDLQNFFTSLVREDPSLYRHTCEGPDDMPAHIKSALNDVSLSIPVQASTMMLGTWQGVFLFEHRSQNHHRSIILHVIGA
ncbi:MAG: YjbQ family protein [Rhodospirillales bacterium]|jgi:secondary thiamine-phosphate synthase enzyme|nr:YjbQ family protein [Rhodospirillales bacterium]